MSKKAAIVGKLFLLIVLSLLLMSQASIMYTAEAATIWVDPVGGNDAAVGGPFSPLKTLTHANVHAVSGDTIEAGPGTYTDAPGGNGEVFPLEMKPVLLKGTNGAGLTTIEFTTDSGDNPALFLSGGPDQGLSGFTVRALHGNGIAVVVGSFLQIDNCIVENCETPGILFGGGGASGGLVFGNIIRNNGGPAITLMNGSSVQICNNLIVGNSSAGGMSWPAAGISISDSTGQSGTVNIFQNTIYGNIGGNGRGVGYEGGGTSAITVTNCIVDDNTDDLYGVSATYSFIGDGDAGTGNLITGDPGFKSIAGEDYHLAFDSQCIDAGEPNDVADDLDGESRPLDGDGDGTAIVDMGCYERRLETYFVDPVNGNDTTGTGNPYNPLKTITQATKIAEPGDSINACPGTYTDAEGGNGEVFPIVFHDVILFGAGRDSTFIERTVDPEGGGSPATVVLTGGPDFTGVCGFTIRGMVSARGFPIISDNTIENSPLTGINVSKNPTTLETGGAGIFRNIIRNNTGPGVLVKDDGSSAVIQDNLIYNNSSWWPPSSSNLAGAGISITANIGEMVDVQIKNNTIVKNTGGNGRGIGVDAGAGTANVPVVNCIVHSNTDDLWAVTNVTYTCTADTVVGTGNIYPGSINEVGFRDYAGNDFHLIKGSPCIDTGNPSPSIDVTDDLDGDIRPIDGDAVAGAIIDMGCYEYDPWDSITPQAYLAEGFTGSGFYEYLCIQNPNQASARAEVSFMKKDGSSVVKRYIIPPMARQTIDANAEVGPDFEIAALVKSDASLVVERPMYFNFQGLTGGHDVMGTPSPMPLFYFAEGCTLPGFHEYLCLQNPGDTTAEVTITYYKDLGGPVAKRITVAPNSRKTVYVNDPNPAPGEGGLGPNFSHSTMVASTQPIVAERPMYFNFFGLTGGHNVMGATSLNNIFYFAEGYTGSGFYEYICLMNPGSSDATVTLTYMKDKGAGTVPRTVTVPANSRRTVIVHETASTLNPGGLGSDITHSTMVESTVPIVAERPMYFNFQGLTGGHNVMGATAAATTLYFAEGCTGSGFTEYICLMNPDSVRTANVTLTYMKESGLPDYKYITIQPLSRKTVEVNKTSEGVGPDFPHSTRVVSTIPVIAERPMYFNFQGIITGGHDVVGYIPPAP